LHQTWPLAGKSRLNPFKKQGLSEEILGKAFLYIRAYPRITLRRQREKITKEFTFLFDETEKKYEFCAKVLTPFEKWLEYSSLHLRGLPPKRSGTTG
jgi:hypothetical protein